MQQQQQHEQQQQQKSINNNNEQMQTHAHLTGHCHYHNNQSVGGGNKGPRSATTTPTQSRRTTPQAHSHSHSHAHVVHSHSNQASPFNSRHTSPHSHHSHSYHSSPHQSRTQLQQVETQQQQPTHKILKTTSQKQHAHHHHHHHHNQHRRSRSRRAHSHSHAHAHSHVPNCSRKHRSVTDVSSNSLNTSCRDVLCAERELRQIFTRKKCCSSSRAELAQYFAEDLYGSSSRRPSSCCTSSDYCYQTDSTSLYGSRSSHESIKSAHVPMKRNVKPQRSRSQPTSQNGSLVSIYAEQTTMRKKKVLLSPSEITIEQHNSKDALNSDLPEYACSPSPIRWSFLGELSDEQEPLTRKNGRKASTASEGREREREKSKKHTSWKKSVDELPSCSKERVRMHRRSKSTAHNEKVSTSPFTCNFEETSDTVLFHQEAESYNNCCNNYIQCNTYLDQDLQITSEDIHQYLNKSQEPNIRNKFGGNGKNYPFQPTNALETQYKHNFAPESCDCQASSGKEQTIVSEEAHHSGFLAHAYPTYDYTNMSCNTAHAQSSTSSDDQHSSLLQSPEPVQVSFESFDAASERKLLSPQTPHSESPCSSTYSVAINPAAAGSYVHGYVNVNEAEQQNYHHHHHHHLHSYQQQHQHHHNGNGDSFKLSHAFRNVRKRARKYTEFLRKK